MSTWTGIDQTIQNFDQLEQDIVGSVFTGLNRGAIWLWGRVRENISSNDHTLKELAAMGHPYARRAPKAIHSPEWLIHRQSGKMYNALDTTRAEQRTPNIITAEVGYDQRRARHAKYVILGTSKMIGRDVLSETANMKKDDLLNVILEPIKEAVGRYT